MGIITGSILVATLLGGGHHLLGNTIGSRQNDAIDSYNEYKKRLDAEGLGNLKASDVLNRLASTGYIDMETHEQAMSLIADAEKAYEKGGWKEFLYRVGHSGSTDAREAKLWDILATGVQNYYNVNAPNVKSVDDVYAAIGQAFTTEAPNPNPYRAATINPNKNTMDVKDLKWWTNPELADLHGIDYDMGNWYDRIKEGTQAEIKHQDFVNQQLNNASLQGDTASLNNYLANLSDTKANAVINGATLGARTANEILNGLETAQDYSSAQQQVAAQSLKNLDPAYLNDASARINARNYYDNIANTLANDVETLFYNDVNRRGGELMYNANIYKANQAYNAAAIQANAAIDAAYQQAAAAGSSNANQYRRWFDMYYNSNLNTGITDKQKIAWALDKVDDAIMASYSGTTNMYDLYQLTKE